MNENEKKALREAFASVRPYLNSPSSLEDMLEKLSESSSDMEEFESAFEKRISDQEDPSKQADYRIFLNKLQSR